MNDREKLVGLHDSIIQPGQKTLRDIADYLLANGVTVPQWHNAETNPPKEANEYIVMIKGGASATALLYDEEEWFEMQGDERIGYHVTHWMPLPEPPKEDE